MSRHHKPHPGPNHPPHRPPHVFRPPKPKPHHGGPKPHHAPLSDRLKMVGLLHSAHESLRHFLHPNIDIIKQIPISLLSTAKGIIFLTVIKGGFILGGEGGTGILLIRNKSNNKWSNPIAIGIGGIKFGFQIGASKVDYIMILTSDNSVKTFMTNGQLKLGGDLNISAGPVGRDTDLSIVGSSKSITTIYSYSMSKGAYLGVTLKAEIISVRNQCNNEFYGKKTTPDDIIKNKVSMKPNDDYYKICNLLNMHVKKNELVNYEKINDKNNKNNKKNEKNEKEKEDKNNEKKEDLDDMELETSEDTEEDPSNKGQVTI